MPSWRALTSPCPSILPDYLGLELVVNPMDFNGVLTELQTKHAASGHGGPVSRPGA